MLRIALLACLVVALAMLSAPAPGASTRRADLSFASPALGARLHYEVYLPADYATSTRHYPVVYFLHGLPAAPNSYRHLRWLERSLAHETRSAILVVPQAARADERDPEYVDQGLHDDWGTAIAKELPRAVDARFRTIADRAGRAIVGLSAGGFGAMHLALKHLGEFSVVESWSGYFHPTNPAGTRPLDLGSPVKNAKANVHRQLAAERAQLRSKPLLIAFYVGRSDRRFEPENIQLDREMRQAHLAHVFRVYPGGHTQQLWRAHAEEWLALALAHLTPAR